MKKRDKIRIELMECFCQQFPERERDYNILLACGYKPLSRYNIKKALKSWEMMKEDMEVIFNIIKHETNSNNG